MTTIRNPLFDELINFKDKVMTIQIKKIKTQKEYEEKVLKCFQSIIKGYWYDTTMAQNFDTILSNTFGYSVFPYKYNIGITTTIY